VVWEDGGSNPASYPIIYREEHEGHEEKKFVILVPFVVTISKNLWLRTKYYGVSYEV